MNTKGIKFLAVLAVLAMAFAAFAVIADTQANDADPDATPTTLEELKTALTAAAAAEGEYIIQLGANIKVDVSLNIPSNATIIIPGTYVLTIGHDMHDGNKRPLVEVKNEGKIQITGTTSCLKVAEGTLTKGTTMGSVEINSTGANNVGMEVPSGIVTYQNIICKQAYNPVHVAGNSQTYDAEFSNNNVTLVGQKALWVQLDQGQVRTTTISNNTFVSDRTDVKSCIQLGGSATEVVGGAGTTILISGNDFTGVKGFASSTDATYSAVKFVGKDYSIAKTAGKLPEAGGVVFADDSKQTEVFVGFAGDNVKLLDNYTFGYLGIKGNTAKVLVLEDVDVTTTGDLNIVTGALSLDEDSTLFVQGKCVAVAGVTNNGIIKVTDVVDSAKFAGKVQVDGYNGNVDKTVIDTEIDDESYAPGVEVIVSAAAVTSATVPADKALVITNVTGLTSAEKVIDVSADNSEVSIVTAGTATFSLDVGGTKKVTVAGLTGTATFSKGSIIINGENVTAGTITLHNGDVVKIDGTVGGVTFNYGDETGSAKIIVEEGKTLTLTGALNIGSAKITLDINGKVNGAFAIATAANATPVNINDGAVVTGTSITGSAIVTVYSGSDINAIGAVTWANVTGKDAASGTWSYDTAGEANILKLNNYNGTYNFSTFAAAIKKIDLTGDNVVTYAFAEDFVDAAKTLLGGANLTSITSDTSGSLTVQVDLSSIAKEQLFQANRLTVIAAGALNINGVDVAVEVTGANASWTETQTKAMMITGIDAASITTYDAEIGADIMSDYTSAVKENVVAVDSAGTTTFDKADLIGIDSAGTGLLSLNKITISNSGLVGIGGAKIGIDANAVAMEVRTTIGVAVAGGADVGALTVLKSAVVFAGDVAVASVSETNTSSVGFTGTATIEGEVDIKQDSEFAMKDGELQGALTNGGIVAFTGNVVVTADTGSITNNSEMSNSGLLGVYGALTNNGNFVNTGTINVYKYKFAGAGGIELVGGAEDASDENHVKVYTITFTDADMKANGSADMTANVVFRTNDTTLAAKVFTGTLMPSINGSYVLFLDNATEETAATATITLTFDSTQDTLKFGKAFAISTTGFVMNAETPVYLENNKTGDESKTVTNNITGTTLLASGANFVTNKDKTFDNTAGTVVVSAATVAENEIVKGTFKGDLTTNIAAVKISGAMTGDLTANGTGLVTITKKFTGNVVSKGSVTASEIVGDITANGSVTVTKMTGDITVDRIADDAAVKNVTVKGESAIGLTYHSAYKATKDAKAGEETIYTAKMDIAGTPKGDGFVINLAVGANATESVAVIPGFFKIAGTAALDDNKTVDMKLTEGRILVDSAVVFEKRYYLTIEAGATIEVNKSAASLDVKQGALKVSKDAIALFETGAGVPVEYGKVLFKMSFQIDDGAYTIYSDVAYALINCNENSDLTVGESAVIEQAVEIKAGVNVIVGKDIVLTFDGKDVKMLDGAKITLEDNGKVVFNSADDNTAEADADATGATEYEFYSVSGTIVFGDNTIAFEKVRIDTDGKFVTGIAATEAEPAKLSIDLAFNEGAVAITAGNAIGKMDVNNASYSKTYADAHAVPAVETPVMGVFYIAEEAVFETNVLTDAPGDYELDAQDEIQINMVPTIVTVDGTLKLLDSITVNGIYGGEGRIVLADTKTITIEKGYYLDDDKKLGFYAPLFDGTVVDTTDAENGYVFEDVIALPDRFGLVDGESLVIKADKLSSDKVVSLTGSVLQGTITALNATTVAVFNGLDVYEDATVIAEKVSVQAGSMAGGLVMTKELEEKTGVHLLYEVTYASGDYTVYTMFATVDFDEISDITIADNASLADLTDGAGKLDLSGKDVNITVAEGKVLIVDIPLIIGTPATTLGSEGSSISGIIVIGDILDGDTWLTAYLVAYADVDLFDAEIYGYDGETDAVYSILDIEDVPYATLFANEYEEAAGVPMAGVVLAKADKSIVPQIAGYAFTAWNNYDGDKDSYIGQTNAYAGAKAILVSVTVKFAEGVSYYCDGVEFAIYDTPTKVEYNSVFTAKINNTAKYQGTPLINGKNSFIVTEDATLTVSGVTPIPEPEPEPVIGDSGISLTDILLIVLVVLIAIMVVILVLRLNRS